MSKREKIILVLLVVVGIYGAYTYLFENKQQNHKDLQKEAIREANEFLAEISKETAAQPFSEIDDFIVTKAMDTWDGESFIHSDALLESEINALIKDEDIKKDESEIMVFKYSGFLEMGEIKFAIINGVEYEEGDALESGGYTVKSIKKSGVVLLDADGNDLVVNPEDTL